MPDAADTAARSAAVSLPALDTLPAPHDAASSSDIAATDSAASSALSSASSPAAAAPLPLANADEASRNTGQEPVPRQKRRRGGQPWRVEVTEEGLLAGCEPPGPSPAIARLLAEVLDAGHELSEAEMVQLFAARGADFQVPVDSLFTERHFDHCCLPSPACRCVLDSAT
jgi:hypothetical protein